jgi:hypothetical protein
MIWNGNTLPSMLVIRFLTGFFLLESRRMKIAADYYDKDSVKSLGFFDRCLSNWNRFSSFIESFSDWLSLEICSTVHLCTSYFTATVDGFSS